MKNTEQQNKTTEVLADAKSFSATDEEKESVMRKVSDHLKINPLKAGAEMPLAEEPVLSPYNHYLAGVWSRPQLLFSRNTAQASFSLPRKMLRYVPTFLLFVAIMGGGTAIAANYSVPGDLLYSYKLNVTENLKDLVRWGTGSEAKIAVRRAGERLEETRALAIKGEISEKVKEELKADFSANAKIVKTEIAALEASGDNVLAGIITADFESMLKAFQASFADISAKDAVDKNLIDEMNAEISSYLGD